MPPWAGVSGRNISSHGQSSCTEEVGRYTCTYMYTYMYTYVCLLNHSCIHRTSEPLSVNETLLLSSLKLPTDFSFTVTEVKPSCSNSITACLTIC